MDPILLRHEQNRTFEIANYNFEETHGSHESSVTEWNLDKIFSPVVHFFGFDGITHVPEHADMIKYGENHMDSLLTLFTIGAISYFGFKHLFHKKLPVLIAAISNFINKFIKRRKTLKTFEVVHHAKPYKIHSSSYYVEPTQTTNYGWTSGWADDEVHHEGNHEDEVVSIEKPESPEYHQYYEEEVHSPPQKKKPIVHEQQYTSSSSRNKYKHRDYRNRNRLLDSFEIYLKAKQKYGDQRTFPDRRVASSSSNCIMKFINGILKRTKRD